MNVRMPNPAKVVPEAMQPMQQLWGAVMKSGLPVKILELVHLRTSLVNGCSVCVASATREARKHGETDERLATVGAWRHAPCFSAAERAALGLADAMTHITDRSVTDAIWAEAASHFDEKALAGLLFAISVSNMWNRLNIATNQVAADW